MGRRVLALAVAALLLWGAVGALSDATQTRGDPDMSGTTTAFLLEASHRNSGDALTAATDLWETCRRTFDRRMAGKPARPLGGDQVVLGITPGLGDEAYRKFEGCLQDHTVDRLQADVVSSKTWPSGG